jgi:hypothetical protein
LAPGLFSVITALPESALNWLPKNLTKMSAVLPAGKPQTEWISLAG